MAVSGRFNIEFDPFRYELDAYVLGVVRGEQAKAYPRKSVSERVVVNDRIGDVPVVVYANPADRSAPIFVRRIGDTHLEFDWRGRRLTDRKTDSICVLPVAESHSRSFTSGATSSINNLRDRCIRE